MSNGAIIKKTYIYENIDLRSVTLVKGGRSTFPLFISNLHKALIYQQLTESPYISATYIKPLYISNLQNQTFILSSVQKIGVLALL